MIYRILAFIILALVLMIAFSPYGKKDGFAYPLVYHETIIGAPSDSVFAFLGRSSNARFWSSYVDHITPLNTGNITDGTRGAERRCFKNKNEEGIIWDERITVVEKNSRRQLTIFNMQGFPLIAEGLATEQTYTNTKDGKTRLAFTLFFLGKEPSWIEKLKTYYAAYFVKNIYERNLENIKTIIESGNCHSAPYPHE